MEEHPFVGIKVESTKEAAISSPAAAIWERNESVIT
jgi:hypothetical protein